MGGRRSGSRLVHERGCDRPERRGAPRPGLRPGGDPHAAERDNLLTFRLVVRRPEPRARGPVGRRPDLHHLRPRRCSGGRPCGSRVTSSRSRAPCSAGSGGPAPAPRRSARSTAGGPQGAAVGRRRRRARRVTRCRRRSVGERSQDQPGPRLRARTAWTSGASAHPARATAATSAGDGARSRRPRPPRSTAVRTRLVDAVRDHHRLRVVARCQSPASRPWWASTTSRPRQAGGRLGRNRGQHRVGRVVSWTAGGPSVTRKPDSSPVASQRWTAPTTGGPARRGEAARPPGSPGRRPSTAASRSRSGTTRWIGRPGGRRRPWGSPGPAAASLPGDRGLGGGVGPGRGEAVVPVGDDRARAREGLGESRARRRSPATAGADAVGVVTSSVGSPRRAAAVSSATVGSGSWASTIGSRSVAVAARRARRSSTATGIGVLVREDRGGARRRERHRAQPAHGRRCAVGDAARRATGRGPGPARERPRPASSPACGGLRGRLPPRRAPRPSTVEARKDEADDVVRVRLASRSRPLGGTRSYAGELTWARCPGSRRR